jgi:hypothetical protein
MDTDRSTLLAVMIHAPSGLSSTRSPSLNYCKGWTEVVREGRGKGIEGGRKGREGRVETDGRGREE